MYPSYPTPNNVTVSFRCSESLKKLIDDTAQSYNISNSELIRHGVEVMIYLLNNPMICEQASEELHTLLEPIFNGREEFHDELNAENSPIFSAIERHEVDLRNIKLLNRIEHGFDGCRVTIVRNKRKFERYFSAKEYGSMDAALAVALKVRDDVLEQLLIRPNDMAKVFARAKVMSPPSYSRHSAGRFPSDHMILSKQIQN